MESFTPQIADLIAAHLNTSIPETLWHYTSMGGCHGIIVSQRIFATDARFLNDRLELRLAERTAEEMTNEFAEVDELGFSFRSIYAQAVRLAFKTGPLAFDRMQVFVASFTELKDGLSQWRGYSYGSSGVSLGFDLRHLRPPAGVETFVTFAPCVYDPVKKRELVRSALKPYKDVFHTYRTDALALFKERQQSGDPIPEEGAARASEIAKLLEPLRIIDRLQSAHNSALSNLISIIALLKDESFIEEREWRLVLPVQTSRANLINPPMYRIRSDALIPTIQHPLAADTSFPLRELIIGPGAHADADSSMNFFLRSKNLMVRAQHSNVPFRPT